ncbi:MAG: STAS domain-containing protein [Candidatus Eremiobacteraeota bacterium]|nr:STAS domain-containing protein [Candidatus Eremiobacteraeota bacterium]
MEDSMVAISPCTLDQAIKIIHLPAKIDSSTAEKVTSEAMAAFEGNPGGILFNLKEVTFVSSAGIRMFIMAYKKAKAEGIKIAMIHVHPNVYKIFKVAALDSEFNICDSEAQALKEVWLLQS